MYFENTVGSQKIGVATELFIVLFVGELLIHALGALSFEHFFRENGDWKNPGHILIQETFAIPSYSSTICLR